MPPWVDFLSQLSRLSAWPAFVGVLVTSTVIVIARDWRFWLWALLAQYVLVSALHLRMLAPQLALLKLVVGVLICPMLRLRSGRRVPFASSARRALAGGLSQRACS